MDKCSMQLRYAEISAASLNAEKIGMYRQLGMPWEQIAAKAGLCVSTTKALYSRRESAIRKLPEIQRRHDAMKAAL
jgi:hypothetical protein